MLTNEYPPHVYGGAGVHVEYLSRELARLEGGRHEIQILCFGEQKEDRGNLNVEGVQLDFDFPFQDLRHRKLLDTLYRNIMMAGSAKDAAIVHCHTWYSHLAGCIIKQLFHIPLVITTHSLEPHRPWKADQLGSAYRATSWIEKTAFENADGVIAVSKSMKTAVRELYRVPEGKIATIPNGIDVAQYNRTLDPSVLSRYGIRPDKAFILFVGRITKQKGILHLVHAIRSLDPGIQVVLCAGAPDTEEIGKQMVEKVKEAQSRTDHEIVWLDQWIPRAHIVSLYSHASVFVCPSVYEPFGIINLEAMACGTPVVASAVGGIPEVVADGQTGVLVPFQQKTGNVSEPEEPIQFARDLAAAINGLLRSPEKVKTMGLKARERVERCFSWESVARQTMEFYQELIRRKSEE